MHTKLSRALLEDIYYPVSAVISFGEKQEVLGIHLFDTAFGGEHMCIEAETKEIWLMSNHPDGCFALSDADWDNLRRLQRLANGRRVRVFLSSENFSCREVGLFETQTDVL